MNAHTPAPLALTDGLADFEVENIILEQMAACDRPVMPTTPTEADLAANRAYDLTQAWMALYEKERSAPGSVEYGQLFDARSRMQQAHRYHADLLEIARIGDIGLRWELRPCDAETFELARNGAAPSLMRVPRRLPAAAYRAFIAAYGVGQEDGKVELQRDMRRLLGLSGAVV